MKRMYPDTKLRDDLMLNAKKSNKTLYLLSFFLPMVVLELVYATFQVFPFGNDSLLVLDLNAQYIYYYEAFRDAVLGEGSLIYNWSRTLGGEMFGLNAYYMGSPFMIVYVLFPAKYITEALLTVALLKTGCASLSFAYYLKKTRGGQTAKILIFSCMYSLMTYMVMHQMDPMWLDAMIYLPMIMLGVEGLVKEGKFALYTAALSLTFVANFYIGYMVAIFTAAYFFYAYFTTCQYGPGNFKRFIKRGALFAAFSLLSAAIAAFMLIPAYFSLTLGKFTFSNPSFAVKAKFVLFDMLPKFMFAAYDTCRPEGLPTLYTGTLTLIMLPLYFTNNRIDVKKKIMSAVMLLFLFISMNISTADLIWHGFQNPNWLNYRYSFIICAFMLIMCYETFSKVDGGYTPASVGKSMLATIALAVIVDKYGFEYIDTRITIWGTLLFSVVYFGFVAFDAHRLGRRNFVTLSVMLGVICAELYLNGFMTLVSVNEDVVFSSRTSYRSFVDKTMPAVNWLKAHDTGFYRTEKTYTRTVNDPMAFGFKGISHSSSTLNTDAINYVKSLGYSVGAHWTEYKLPTIPIDAIIGIKYVLSDKEADYGLTLLHEENGIYIYENPCAMPICYPVDAGYLDYDNTVDNPFELQNAMFSAMVGSDNIINFYKRIDSSNVAVEYNNIETKQYGEGYTKYFPEDEGSSASLEFIVSGVEDEPIYAAFPTSYPRKVSIKVNGVYYNTYLESSEDDGIIPLGSCSDGESVTLEMTLLKDNSGGKNEVFLKNQLFYTFDSDLFNCYFGELKNEVDEVKMVHTTTLKMNINATSGQVLYTSIPYERGWTATVDGVGVPVYRTGSGLVGIDLPEGQHEITLKFLPDYFIYACIISASALVLFIAIIIVIRICKKRGYRLPTAKSLLRLADGDDEEEQSYSDVGGNEVEFGSGDTVEKIGKLVNNNGQISENDNPQDVSEKEETDENPENNENSGQN